MKKKIKITLFAKLIIIIYNLLIKFLAICNVKKAKYFIKYRKNIFLKIKATLKDEQRPILWFHCASVGEFEQAKPLLEKFFTNKDKAILITFFSPSGYMNIRSYKYAHYIFPLPVDSKSNSKKFLDIVNPEKIFFIKYDYWPFYFKEISKRKIQLFMISVILHTSKSAVLVRNLFHKNLFYSVSHFFLQDQASAKELTKLGFTNYSVVGDTRFDRVYSILKNPVDIPVVKNFLNVTTDIPSLIMGSVYLKDLEVFIKFNKQFLEEKKYLPYNKTIIVPHELSDTDKIINLFVKRLQIKPLLYSKLASGIINKMYTLSVSENPFLIVDVVGKLPYIYQYTNSYHKGFYTYAYVGGGFNKGVHNCLEPAVFGMAVIIGGNNYKKSKEVLELMKLGGCFNIKNKRDFSFFYKELLNSSRDINDIIKKYIGANINVSDKIVAYVKNCSCDSIN